MAIAKKLVKDTYSFDQVKNLLVKYLYDAGFIKCTNDFDHTRSMQDQLPLDSLDWVELIIDLENEYSTEISDAMFQEYSDKDYSFDQLVNAILEYEVYP